MIDHRKLLIEFDHDKVCIGFSKADKIDYVLIRKLLVDNFDSVEKPC